MKVDIIGGDDRLFRAAAFGLPDRESLQRSYNRLEDFSRNISDRAKEHLGKAKELIGSIFDESIAIKLNRVLNNQRGIYRRDAIQFLDSAEEIALAPVKMRRWIISNPRVRKLFDRQAIHAWGSKKDAFDLPEAGESDPFWRALNNGVAAEDENGQWWTEFEHGLEELTKEPLRLDEQLDLIATMDILNQTMDDGIDPTNPFGESF